mmetsp:Transcript_19453/g.52937  ORF Transcript_19453/g.52937 Transcript_19453/m.52937 type:complete len:461 (-) Transcript_19453:128-1510(-)
MAPQGFSARPSSCCFCFPSLRMLSRASRATPMILASETRRRSTKGLMQPHSMRWPICCGEPPDVALLMAHAASFLMSKSAVCRRLITGGTRPQLMTSWIWSRVPAVTLEIVQQASFLIVFFECVSSAFRLCRTPPCRITCVCWSSPVTMLPTALSAGVCTSGDVWPSSSMSLWQTPAWMTAVMRSLGPSERYESAQQASVSTSTSEEWMRCASVASAGDTHSKGGGGLPRQKFERVQQALRIMETFSEVLRTVMTGCRPPLCSTRSRKFGESPAMLPSAHTACSRTSSFGEPRSSTKMGRAPISTTTRVCSAVPEAMFVRTQAASNWRSGRDTSFRNCTKRGTIPALMTSWIGGFCSTLRSFLNCWVALKQTCWSSETSCWQSTGIWSSTPADTEGALAIWSMESLPIAAAPDAWPPPATACSSSVMRFFCSASSRVCFRSCTAASSRFLRASSASTPFL